MIVGEAPGADEERYGEPFCGYSGKELTKMLHEAGINRSECFITNVARERPLGNDIANFIAFKKKDRTSEHKPHRDKWVKQPILSGVDLLYKEIEMVKPNVIIALGNVPLWALTGLWGILKWRGSMLYDDRNKVKVVPTIHPASVLRQWDQRALAVLDLKRAARFRNGEPYPIPKWNFKVRPSFMDVVSVLEDLQQSLHCSDGIKLSFDIETRMGHIACAGISWTLTDGICIPLMCVENKDGYWNADEEAALVLLLSKILTHPNAQVVGQNLLYDSQYTYRWWHFKPNVHQDTMISHHTCFSGLKKSLDFQSSMYCDYHRYWKDDSKDWDPKMGEDQLWVYNLEDCVRTQECADAEAANIVAMKLEETHAFQQSMFWPVLETMIRGVKVDLKARRGVLQP